jgi:mRNA degradation ribonuclease J1/J2
MSEPFSEEDIADEVMHNWLKHFHMSFYQLHASGHMNRHQLVERVTRVEAKKVFPIHTENQNLFNKTCRNVQAIKRGKEYVIS